MARKMTEDFIGICQWCFGEYKVNPRGEMVLHGYQRPGYGYTVGNCRGVGHKPFEYDHVLTEERVAELRMRNESLNKQVKLIDDGKVTKIKNPSFIPDGDERKGLTRYDSESYTLEYYTTEHRRFDYYLRAMRADLTAEIRFNDGIIEYLQAAVDQWTKKPIVGLDTPATGRERYVRDAYDPDKAAEAEAAAQRKAERDAKPGKIAINVYGTVFFPDRNADLDEAAWRAGIEKHYAEEKAFKERIKAWAKATFPGKLWVGDGDNSEIRHLTGKSGYDPDIEVIAIRPEWQYLDTVMAMFPNAHRCDKDGTRDRATMQCIGKGKDVRIWVSVDDLPA